MIVGSLVLVRHFAGMAPYALHLGVLLAALACFRAARACPRPGHGNDLLNSPAEEQALPWASRNGGHAAAMWVRFSPRFLFSINSRGTVLVSAGIALATGGRGVEIPFIHPLAARLTQGSSNFWSVGCAGSVKSALRHADTFDSTGATTVLPTGSDGPLSLRSWPAGGGPSPKPPLAVVARWDAGAAE